MRNTAIFAAFSTFLCFFGTSASAQTLSIDTTSRCFYSGKWMLDDLYGFAPDPEIEKAVADILSAGGIERKPKVFMSKVGSVAGFWANSEFYLFYDDAFLEEHRGDKPLIYALVAHELAHMKEGHKLKEASRLREESQADIFVGKTLQRIEGIVKGALLSAVRKHTFSYAIPVEARIKNIKRGWEVAEQELKMRSSGSFFNDVKDKKSIPLPALQPWPPLSPSTSYLLPRSLFPRCTLFSHLDKRLCQALDAHKYDRRSYFHVPGGFALVTQMEQFKSRNDPNKTNKGASLDEKSRWVDYPVFEEFQGVWDYLQGLFVARSGYFRVFVFIVTDEPFSNSARTEPTEGEVRGWLGKGVGWLPEEVGNWKFSERHKVTLMVYEFEAKEIDKKAFFKTAALIQGREHLEKSGIGPSFPRN